MVHRCCKEPLPFDLVEDEIEEARMLSKFKMSKLCERERELNSFSYHSIQIYDPRPDEEQYLLFFVKLLINF